MTLRIAMWSGPRNLSTAMMRAWENRPDTAVLDEPLYAHYLAATGLDHPGRDDILASGPTDPAEAVARCLAPPPPGTSIVYQKHMSHHLLPGLPRDWLAGLRHLLLLRDPVDVLASYSRVRPTVTLADIGLRQQQELADRAELIIDADDFLADPGGYLRAVCAHLGIGFVDEMLAWPAGRRDTDGVWAPHWYASVEASTGFRPPESAAKPTIADLPVEVRPLAEEATEIYRSLAEGRLLV